MDNVQSPPRGNKGLLVAVIVLSVIVTILQIAVTLLLLNNSGVVNIFGTSKVNSKQLTILSTKFNLRIKYSNYWQLIDHLSDPNTKLTTEVTDNSGQIGHSIGGPEWRNAAEDFQFSDQTGEVGLHIVLNFEENDYDLSSDIVKINGADISFWCHGEDPDGHTQCWAKGTPSDILGVDIPNVSNIGVALDIGLTADKNTAIKEMTKVMESTGLAFQ